MPDLTRKRVQDRPETWHIHLADVRVGVIVERVGAPSGSDQWQWCSGLGLKPRDQRSGTALTFDAARAAFATAWADLHVSPSDLDEWRDQEAWTVEKYRRFDRHERMQPDWRPRCG
jgi:hypothetical protein